jgi:hypothetical protein
MQYPDFPARNDPGGREPSFDRRRLVAVVLVVALVTVATYRLMFGWHDYAYGGSTVWTLVALLAMLAWWYGWIGYCAAGSLMQVVASTVVWSIDAATDPHVVGASMWPVGAMFVAVGTAAGAFGVSAMARAVRGAVAGRRGDRQA